MRYRDVVGFEPIVSVIQLLAADEVEQARRLVRTYVISDHMAEQLSRLVVPQLVFGQPDPKGLLIVGNYGTGKSHLMSVVSAVAEHAELAGSLSHPAVRYAATAIAGRYKVVRVEIGAVKRGLRDILVEEIEQAFARWGIAFRFPAAEALTNHKDAIARAVALFQERYPNQGVLLVVDELLDFLRTRDERELILDLGFLRELGEVAQDTDFRFIGGLQESLFDSPSFAFVAQPLTRVRDRFEQVRIARDDINFVVAARLLPKTDEQIARIVDHLRPFAPLYGQMAERLDEFARLFPVHPAYVETFELVKLAEKREVLRTLSNAIAGLVEREVPTDQPGLVAYDQYWGVVSENPSLRSQPGVREVVDKSRILESRIQNAYTRPPLRAMALRIVHALSVLRLTTDDLAVPLGATPEELRDGLTLWAPIPERNAAFLADQVRVALREITRTVSGQYLSHNEANDQFYIDVKKDIDFDAKIGERGEFLSESDLNRYFFDALRLVLNLSDSTYTNVSRLWFFQLPWAPKRVTRPGYLFFTAPDQRSTAQPPRDFYLYVLPPFGDGGWAGAGEVDEVVFALAGAGAEFEALVRRYAGSRALANETSAHREVYAQKAADALRRLRRWLDDHLAEHLTVTYRGVCQPVAAAVAGARSSAAADLGDLIQRVAAAKLEPIFAERYPDYPAFARLTQPVTEESRRDTAAEGVRMVARVARTSQGTAVLEALELLDGEGRLKPAGSRYARALLARLEAKPEGQVVNRGEAIETVSFEVSPVEKAIGSGLEPEWVAVLLVALVQSGDISLSLDGGDLLEAGNVEKAAMIPLDRIADFRFYRRPKSLPLRTWEEIFDVLGLRAPLLRDERTREQAVIDLQVEVAREIQRVAATDEAIGRGLRLWNESVFTDQFTLVGERGAVVGSTLPAVHLTSTAARSALRGYKGLLDRLQRFTSVGKLRNLDLTAPQVDELRDHRAAVGLVERLVETVGRLQPVAAYLAEAQGALAADHPWNVGAAAARGGTLAAVRGAGVATGDPAGPRTLLPQLETLREAYRDAYVAEHGRLTLGPEADDRRTRLMADRRVAAAKELTRIEPLDRGRLAAWSGALSGMATCREFHPVLLDEGPTCPYCKLRPGQKGKGAPAAQVLDQLDRRLDEILDEARAVLRRELGGDTVRRSIAAMTRQERAPIDAFLAQGADADDPAVPAGFAGAATAALRGIETVAISEGELLGALGTGGWPAARAEVELRLRAFLDEVMTGKDRNTTRLTVTGDADPGDA